MSEHAPIGYQFGGISLLLDQRLLLRDGVSTRLGSKPFNILLLLLESAPRPVTKDEFADKVWHDTTVEDSNLVVQINYLRKLFGDSPKEAGYIQTIPKEGYRFVAAVTEIESLQQS